jgi:hypothetical protein
VTPDVFLGRVRVTKTRKRDTAQRATTEARSPNKQSAQARQFVMGEGAAGCTVGAQGSGGLRE